MKKIIFYSVLVLVTALLHSCAKCVASNCNAAGAAYADKVNGTPSAISAASKWNCQLANSFSKVWGEDCRFEWK